MRLDEYIISQATKKWNDENFTGDTHDVMAAIIEDQDFINYLKGLVVFARKKTDDEKAAAVKIYGAGRLKQ